MIILTIIFGFIVRIKIEKYPLFLLTALIPWNFFSISLLQSTNSIVANASLINKVYLPKELFPFSLILSNLVGFIFSLGILIVLLFFFDIKLNLISVCLLPVLIFSIIFFCAGVSLIFSCLNVFFRDLSHIIGVIITLWFYASPIFYSIEMVPEKYLSVYLIANPMALIIHSFREVLFYVEVPKIQYLFLTITLSLIVFILGYGVFTKYEHLFPELI
jgi:ABC-2 type transport system permease protein